MEAVLDEAEVADDSTPAVDEAPASSQSDAVETDQGDASEADRAPAAGKVPDPDKAAWDRLVAKEDPKAIRQSPKPLDPSPTRTKVQQGKAKTKPESESAPVEGDEAKASGTDDQDDGEEYGGYDPKGIGALRRAKLLPSPADWELMSPTARNVLAAAARKIIAAKGEISQRLGQQRAQQTTQQQPGETDEYEYEADWEKNPSAKEPEARTAPAPSRQQRQDVRAQTQQPARAVAQPDASIDDMLDPLKEYLGKEATGPIKAVFEQVSHRLIRQQQELSQLQQMNQEERQESLKLIQEQARQTEGLARQFFLPQERDAFKDLEAETGSSLADAQRQEITANAFHFFEASANAGQAIDWKTAVIRAGRSILTPDIKQQAQAGLLDRRQQSLRGTSAKGNGTARSTKPLTADEKDRKVFDVLALGKSVADAQAAIA